MFAKTLLSLIIVVTTSISYVYAANEHHAGPPQILAGDISRILWHSFNLGLLFLGLYLMLRKQIKEYFASRGEHFNKAVAAAEKAKAEAEHHNIQIKEKLRKLEETAHGSIEKAKAEADEMKKQMAAEAKKVSAKILQENDRMIEAETFGAAHHLKEEFVDLSVKGARTFIKSAITESEQQRLNKEFIEKVQVLR